MRITPKIHFGAWLLLAYCAGLSWGAGSMHALSRKSGLPDTAQSAFYASGDDSSYNPAAAGPVYKDNGDGTVTDKLTGLMWPKDGFSAGCFNGNYTTWSTALNYCETLNFAGYTGGWRLPNIRELQSIVDYGTTGTTVVNSIFTNRNTAGTLYYWSSTYYAPNTLYAWSIDFEFGDFYVDNVTLQNYVCCVRGGL